MEFIIKPDPAAVADYAAGIVSALVAGKPAAAIAVPTGKTPLPLFQRLARTARRQDPALDQVNWFALDEFVGQNIPGESTFAFLLEERLIKPAGLSLQQLHSLSGKADDPAEEAQRYEQLIESRGGLDLAILGIGGNGHIGINEPGTPFDSRTGMRELAEGTRQANTYLFPSTAVPGRALTMGVETILEARRVMVLATGPAKALIVETLAGAAPNPAVPATALKEHGDCVIVVDAAAGALL